MNFDIRLSVDFFRNPKTLKLLRRLDYEGVCNLLMLWIWAAENKCSGCLDDMDAEDIELVSGWKGQAGLFASTLEELRWIEREDQKYFLHGWQERQAYAIKSEDRAAASRLSRLAQINKAAFQECKKRNITMLSIDDYNAWKDYGKTGDDLANAGEPPANASESPKKNGNSDKKGASKGRNKGKQSESPANFGERQRIASEPPAPSYLVNQFPVNKEENLSLNNKPAHDQKAEEGERENFSFESIPEEFSDLRRFYSENCRAESPVTGLTEWLKISPTKLWPGSESIKEDIRRRIEAKIWDRGYWPSFVRYLNERTWAAPITPKESSQDGNWIIPEASWEREAREKAASDAKQHRENYQKTFNEKSVGEIWDGMKNKYAKAASNG